MIFAEPPPSRYDLHLRVLGFPVRVHPFFWLVSALLGIGPEEEPELGAVLVWVVCVFVSILLHELGHALAMRALGRDARIVLYGFGGLTISSHLPWANRTRLSAPWDQVLISLAGPGAGFLAVALLWLILRLVGTPLVFALGGPLGFGWYFEGIDNPRLEMLLGDLVFINFFWGLVNLVPVHPLDGGKVLHALLVHFQGPRAVRQVHLISAVVAALVAVLALVRLKSLFVALLFGLLAAYHFRSYQDPWSWRT